MAKKKKHKPTTYRIRYDHKVDGSIVKFPQNKDEGLRLIRRDLSRFPYVKASLQKAKTPFGTGWKAHRTYKFRKSKKTGRHRLVEL